MKNPYIILLLKVVLLTFAIFLVDFLIGFCFKYLRNAAYEKNPLSTEMSTCYCIEDASPDIAIIGSSTANHHYIPQMIEDSTGLSAYNFGHDGCFLYYQCALISLMTDRYTPSYIIWEIGESSLSNGFSDRYEYQSINYLYPWYGKKKVKDIVNKKDCFQRIRMFFHSYRNNSSLLYCLRLCRGDYNKHEKGYYPLYNKTYPNKISNDTLLDYTINPYNVKLLKQTIEECKNKGVNIIFTSSPRFIDDVVKQTDCYKKLREIAADSGIPFIDYYNHEPFNNDSTLFKDNAHMNHIGTEMYMSMFIPELKNVLSLNNEE